MILDEKLLQTRHRVGMEAHIEVDADKCASCLAKPCVTICPANCFTLEDETINFGYEGCLECGTCNVICPNQAISWDYPLGGYGISFRIG